MAAYAPGSEVNKDFLLFATGFAARAHTLCNRLTFAAWERTMNDMKTCPSVQQLKEFLLGQGQDQIFENLEDHVSDCPRCNETLHALEAEDTLVARMRRQKPDMPRAEKAVVDNLIGQLKQLLVTAQETSRTMAQPTIAADMEPLSFLAPAQGPNEIGRLGSYRILKVLGTGGMGMVFEAEDPNLKRTIALKIMKPSLAVYASARERFLREAQTAAKLNHDHIISIYQVGEAGGIPFLAMPVLQGETLEDRLRKQAPLPTFQVLRIGREIAEGLAAAHERGLIHRDIKPANIWLEQGRDRVKIVDFGLARAAGSDPGLTHAGAILGSPSYMAPEQARAEEIDARCDLFSLGCVLYRMCTGELPFKGKDVTATLLALSQDQPRPFQEINPAVPAPLSNLIMRLLAKDRNDRPTSAKEVADALADMELEHSTVLKAGLPAANRTMKARDPVPSSRRRLFAAAVLLAIVGPLAFLFAPTLIRIATNKGELVIQTDDADVEVTVTQAGAKVLDRSSKRWFELKAGDYEIEVREMPNGLSFFTKEFKVTRGGKVTINVKLELAAAGKKPKDKEPVIRPVTIQPEPLPTFAAEEPLNRRALVAKPAALKGVRSWTIETRGHRTGIQVAAFSPDGKRLLTTGHDGTLRIWKRDTGELVRVLVPPANEHYVFAAAWSPDGGTLATGHGDHAILLWDMDTGRLLRTLRGHQHGSVPWPGRRMAKHWPPEAWTRPSASGSHQPESCGITSRNPKDRFGPWPGRPMENSWPPPEMTRPFASGTPARAISSRPWTGTMAKFKHWPGRRTASPWPAAAPTKPCASGTLVTAKPRSSKTMRMPS